MTLNGGQRGAVARAQDIGHGAGHDYIVGSPHLRHAALRKRIDRRISDEIKAILRRQAECKVLEVGAGHGFFTDSVLNAGGTATVTEMSAASYSYLSERFRENAAVRILYDADGNAAFDAGLSYDVILLISVIHHIPDYLGVVTRLCDQALNVGGTVVTFQDPLWYPRQKPWQRAVSSGAYFAWRIGQGELRRGLATRWRRLRGVYSESEPSDLVEYHVVRQGVDEVALQSLFHSRFAETEIDMYFSTQSPRLQALAQSHAPPNTFGIVGRGYRG